MDVRPRHLGDRKRSGRSRLQTEGAEEKARQAIALAKRYFEGFRSSPRPADLEDIRLSYARAISEIAGMREVKTWEAERQILPDELKNIRCAPFGLPETPIPFSLSHSWKNPLLEQALLDLPDRSNQICSIARILDRYVQTSFLPEVVSEFYRSQVAELQLAAPGLDEPAYLFRLIRLSRELTEKHHNLKRELHKSISIETGDPLAQPNPEVPARIKLTKIPLSKRKSTTDELARSLMQRLRVPAVDGIVSPKYLPPSARDLQNQLDIVLKSGREATYSHPDLPGMEFTGEQCATAFTLTINGDFFTRITGTGLKVPVALAPLLNVLSDSEAFAEATLKKDRKGQLKAALEVSGKAAHVAKLMEENAALGEIDAWQLAGEDFSLAAKMVSEYRSVKFSSPDTLTLTGVRRMLQVARDNQNLAEFDIALAVISEKRANRESLTTLRPPPPELIQQVAEVAQLVQEPPAGRLIFPFPNESLDLELETHLPKGDDPEAKLTRRVARTLRYYVSLGQNGDVPQVYLPAVTRLLSAYSHEEVAEFAQMLVEQESVKTVGKGGTLAMDAPAPVEAPAAASVPPAALPDLEPEPFEDMQPAAPAARVAKTIPDTQAEETRPDFRPIAMMLDKLKADSPNSLELVMAVLGKAGDCTESDLEAFRNMHAGARDLRFRNRLSRVWTDGDWRGQPEVNEPSESEHLRTCMDQLYHVCALTPADMGQMREAATNPANLTASQLAAVGKLFGVMPHNVTPKLIEGLGIWVSGDQQKLKVYQDQNYPNIFALINLSQKLAMNVRRFNDDELALLGIIFGVPGDKIHVEHLEKKDEVARYTESMRSFEKFWFAPSLEQRRNFWKFGALDTLSVTDLVHRAVFVRDWQYSPEDYKLITRIYEKNPESQDEMNNNTTTFVNAILHKSDKSGPLPEVVELHKKLIQNPLRDLLESARSQEEFDTLCDFLSAPTGRAKGRLVSVDSVCRSKVVRDRYSLVNTSKEQNGVFLGLHKRGENGHPVNETVRFISQSKVGNDEFIDVETQNKEIKKFQLVDSPGGGKNLIGEEKYNDTNDDSLSQVVVTLENGETIELDGVFDGMGGHEGGYLASGFMKTVFEISALSGWITTPEDVRKAITMADLVITIEQHKKQQYGSKKMGTTATIGFLKGEDFFETHIGDSDVKIFRGGEMAYSSLGHSLVNQFLANNLQVDSKVKEIAEVISKYALSAKYDPPNTAFRLLPDDKLSAATNGLSVRFTISRDGKTVCEGFGKPMLHEKLIETFNLQYGNVVTGAVGNSIGDMTINNQKHDYAALKVRKGDIILLCSDGITVPLCAHEALIALEQCNGNLKQAAERIVEWAEQRRPNGQKEFKPNCACCERGSKNDDKSAILKRV
jgi:serine/threonine protein phosphatase PrpC